MVAIAVVVVVIIVASGSGIRSKRSSASSSSGGQMAIEVVKAMLAVVVNGSDTRDNSRSDVT